MRPLRLQLKNFTCYRGEQEVDFSHLKLFAIAGPTGAGKSTLLDAMTFALYGQIPRMGSRNLDEFITLGEKEASVVFEFALHGGKRLRVARTMRRNGAKKALLEELTDGGAMPIQDGVRSVDDALGPLLGLGYQAFVQAVLLPQGKFAEFLQGDKGKRREILRELLRLGVYEEMRKRAETQKRDLDTQIQTLDKRLEEDYADATEENLAALKKSASELQQQSERRQEMLVAAEMEKTRLEGLWKLQSERAKQQGELARLDILEPRIEADRQRAEQARRAEALRPFLVRVRAAERTRNEKKAAADAARAAAQQLLAASERMKKALDAAEEAAAEMPKLRARREELLKVLEQLPFLEQARSLLKRLTDERSEATRQAEEADPLAEQSAAKAETLTQQCETVRAEQATIAYDPDRHKQLLALRGPAEEQRRCAAAVADLDERIRSNRAALDEAIETAALARQQWETSAGALRTARDRDLAAQLRGHLHVGEDCPVCGQAIAKLPTTAGAQDLSALEEAAAAADRSKEAAQRNETSVRALLDREEEERRRQRERIAELEDLLNGQDAAVALDQLRKLDDTQRRHTASDQVLRRLEREFQEARLAAQSAADQRDQALRDQQRLGGEMRDAAANLEILEQKFSAAGTNNPASDQKAVDQRLERLLANQDKAKREAGEADSARRDAEQARALAENDLANADNAAAEAAGAADHEVAQAGFADRKAAESAALEPDALTVLEQSIQTHAQRRRDVEAAIASLDEQLSGASVTAEELQDARLAFAAAGAERDRLLDQGSRLAQQLDALQIAVKKASELRAERTEAHQQRQVAGELALELRSDRFQQHLLDDAFQKLVFGASLRLKQLNERYSLQFSNDSFVVMDHENGGELRSADTLSGGETFLASLALALELSEQVQEAAGAVRLDSLFIDEGFGTLDPETLDVVAGAIESLGTGDRMVGVISHVSELHRRLPARLEIRRGPRGSSVELVDAI